MEETEVLERLGFEVQRSLQSRGDVSVWEASYRGQPVVLKCMRWGNNYNLHNAFLEEALAQHQLSHPHICKMLGLRVCDLGLVIVLEHMQSDLKVYLASQQTPLDEANLWLLLKQITGALAYAQTQVSAKQNVAHRDVKPQNILRSAEGRWVLCGFGNAKTVNFGEDEHTMVGTPLFISPQLRQNFGRSDFAQYNPFKSDVYSLGLSLYYAATLQEPQVLAVQKNLQETTQTVVSSLPCSESLKRVLIYMLQVEEADRPDFLQLQNYLELESQRQTLNVSSQSMGGRCTECNEPLRSNYYVAKCGHRFCGRCKGSSHECH